MQEFLIGLLDDQQGGCLGALIVFGLIIVLFILVLIKDILKVFYTEKINPIIDNYISKRIKHKEDLMLLRAEKMKIKKVHQMENYEWNKLAEAYMGG